MPCKETWSYAMTQKAYDMLGLAQRAGKLISGEAAVEANLHKGKGKLVILANDASARTKNKFIQLAGLTGVQHIIAGDKMRFGISLGKSPRSVLCITDEGFARRIKELFSSNL